MCLFKKISSVEIIEYTEGISESDRLTNFVAGHMMGGFDGMVHASLLNNSEAGTTTFLIQYENHSPEIVTVRNESYEYSKYIKYL